MTDSFSLSADIPGPRGLPNKGFFRGGVMGNYSTGTFEALPNQDSRQDSGKRDLGQGKAVFR
jgi:hypothetical protein